MSGPKLIALRLAHVREAPGWALQKRAAKPELMRLRSMACLLVSGSMRCASAESSRRACQSCAQRSSAPSLHARHSIIFQSTRLLRSCSFGHAELPLRIPKHGLRVCPKREFKQPKAVCPALWRFQRPWQVVSTAVGPWSDIPYFHCPWVNTHNTCLFVYFLCNLFHHPSAKEDIRNSHARAAPILIRRERSSDAA